ncbi:DUF4942 domain-containing protein [Leptolyngbyaceae cyanobacterium CCMR0082]|uniref:DUF4942 domain-containing protein n=1 Tax=Adonisia turfae CCMR0082 TaxID=2304604 RepID=A0A6M0SAP8_9CYAN|nr:DUF4942 domain-containing protein [Adonisia turfae]NEZ65547.1 DUF4942 domain-containing protein [Adonisia turfae CCMR0082]
MLENQFFPTPGDVVDRMIEPWVLTKARHGEERDYFTKPKAGDTLIDPQAGTGGILDHVYDRFYKGETYWHSPRAKWYAVEMDYQKRAILTAAYKVIGSDWLQYREPRKFATILSNPPFEQGVKHCLKNLEHLADGGRMACLLNAQSLRNPHTQERKFLLHKLCGYAMIPTPVELWQNPEACIDELLGELEKAKVIEFFGQCFQESERPTDVEVVCIRVELPESRAWTPDWEKMGNFSRESKHFEPEAFRANPLAFSSSIQTMVAKYDAAVRALQRRWEAETEIKYWLKQLPGYGAGHKHTSSDLDRDSSFTKEHTILKSLFWHKLFIESDIGNRIGTTAQKSFEEYAVDQAQLEFSHDNIMEMLQIILLNLDQAMNSLVVEVFDKLVGYQEDNGKWMEGWKTNSPSKIKKGKVIFPHANLYDQYYGLGWREYNIPSFFDDIDKALCWSTGYNYEQLAKEGGTIIQAIKKQFAWISNGGRHDMKFSSHFFDIRIFKKGTIHFQFLDGQHAIDFQVFANKHRKEIGEHDKAEAA